MSGSDLEARSGGAIALPLVWLGSRDARGLAQIGVIKLREARILDLASNRDNRQGSRASATAAFLEPVFA